MSRYDAMFARLHNEGALGAFLMLGDPELATSARHLDALVEGGTDMVEVGIPFSDPVADGPVIQAAAERALKAGVRVDDALELIAGFRKRHPDVPLGILTYANIVEVRGRERFMADAVTAGADSLLVADVPSLEAEPYSALARATGIDLVMIAAPNTGEEALDRLARLSSGYTYCVARAGVTGERSDLALDHQQLFGKLKERNAPPAVLGFGISSPEQVRAALDSGAAGVIVGSAIVRIAAEGGDVAGFVDSLKTATRR
ncbi:tryptophan synthase subunit alpha [Sphingomonas ginkgonis]|uniref:Tryptophan synthase alpha chain n=1 Tax=Sphingomonas ginkgonis TaxID=2315330 RepID=A0A3R9YK21_9SPHN|nr:tryptophan synthase subunit alpha [Sphingomonas ginkgonis]RST29524.1 tryptophan synthase subunit alpha [Sphingomonas ginkgonis]